ncbi:MAG: Rieske (2Fe-2S) protein [Dehalococcoidia bacterium]|nr:Rieske (2Fe-2S) protein [Dehalococcoidia bacterium]
MGTFIVAGNKSDFPIGMMRVVQLEGNSVLVANIDGNFHAINNKCPHMGGNLSRGVLDGTIVTCPLHSSQFDITTGKNIRWLKGSGLVSSMLKIIKSPADVTKYTVRVDDQLILIEI